MNSNTEKTTKSTAKIKEKGNKLEKKQIQDDLRRIKPKECLKYIRCVIDPELIGNSGSQIIETLTNLDIKYVIRPQPGIICWERIEQQKIIQNTDNIAITEKYLPEKHILHILNGEEFLDDAMKSKKIHTTIGTIKKDYPQNSVTLLIFGLKLCLNDSAQFTWSDIELCLTELQILHKCGHRLIESASELGTAVAQFTKAIAEIPFKQQQMEKSSELNLFLCNDNKDCVRVDGSAGLYRLWQQHLTRLPFVTLETAEAVINAYPQPKKLFTDFDNKIEDGISVLSEVKIRRGGGPLQTSRRIGPELSRKIHTLYTSLDPDEVL